MSIRNYIKKNRRQSSIAYSTICSGATSLNTPQLAAGSFIVNILLNTHSPYFLNAIEVYSQKYNIGDLCKFYLADENNGITRIVDVTNETEKIYAKLARPLQELENTEYGNTGV